MNRYHSAMLPHAVDPMSKPVSNARRRLRHLTYRCALLVLTLVAATSTPAFAQEYRVEVVLFEHLRASTPGNGNYWVPSPRSAVLLDSERAVAAGFITDENGERELEDDAARMNASGRYRVLRHMVWQQPGLDNENAIRIRMASGSRIPLWIAGDADTQEQFIPASAEPRPGREDEVASFTVDGTLRVRLGRFLHVESRLVYHDVKEGRSYRLFESRKMRSRELHYIDNPRFGILTRIVPVEDSEQDAVADSADILEEGVDDAIDAAVDAASDAAPN